MKNIEEWKCFAICATGNGLDGIIEYLRKMNTRMRVYANLAKTRLNGS